ncbi:ATP-dependent DNA ligase, partial [Escherichia coli]|uniref:hypothetical protein n=1 Tax=Escherichia coli TaxID=562 RepID=UPI003F7AAA55|nr:ATP-dependent DNA ligase [Escherichia coli]
RKSAGRKLLAEAPVAFIAYDLLEWRGEDSRGWPLAERRAQLEAIVGQLVEPRLQLSARLVADDWSDLARQRAEARERG